MKSAVFVILLGLAAGALAHVTWYAWRRPATSGPDDVVAWMKTDLSLSDAQFARISALHRQSGPQLRDFASRAQQMRTEVETFERTRRAEGRVDFLAFAQCLETWRRIDRDWSAATRHLVDATSGELTAEQRARYLTRLTPASVRSVN